jgi:hypothetical protein
MYYSSLCLIELFGNFSFQTTSSKKIAFFGILARKMQDLFGSHVWAMPKRRVAEQA